MMRTVIATPAERWALYNMLFQNGPEGQPLVRIANGAEGRIFRSFMACMGLLPIQRAVGRFGRINTAMSSDQETVRAFLLPPDCVSFFRQRLADLPRSAAQEMVAGALLDSLHCVGPGRYSREDVPPGRLVPPWNEAAESWTPDVVLPAAVLADLTVSASAMQGAMERFEGSLAERELELPPPLREVLGLFQEDVLSAIAGADRLRVRGEASEPPEAA